MKSFIKIGAVALASCAAALSLTGCGGRRINTTVTNSNWFTGTSYPGIQPSFILNAEHAEFSPEEIVYEVTHNAAEATNSSYSAEYSKGSFTTVFYATEYDWNAENVPEKYRKESKEVVYYYKNELNIKVRYTMKNGAQSDWLENKVVNESYFRAAGKNLQPVYSKQQIKSASPAKRSPKTLEEAYTTVNAVYENFYSYDCVEISSFLDGQTEPKVYDRLDRVKNTLFDNSYAYIAARSMNLTTQFSQTVSMFSAAAGGISDYAVNTVAGSDGILGSDDRKAISAVLEDAELFRPVTTDAEGNAVEDEGVKTVAVQINYAGKEMLGAPQTVWFAAIDNPDLNYSRATMLKISAPLGYNLGTLNYTIKTINSTLWSR